MTANTTEALSKPLQWETGDTLHRLQLRMDYGPAVGEDETRWATPNDVAAALLAADPAVQIALCDHMLRHMPVAASLKVMGVSLNEKANMLLERAESAEAEVTRLTGELAVARSPAGIKVRLLELDADPNVGGPIGAVTKSWRQLYDKAGDFVAKNKRLEAQFQQVTEERDALMTLEHNVRAAVVNNPDSTLMQSFKLNDLADLDVLRTKGSPQRTPFDSGTQSELGDQRVTGAVAPGVLEQGPASAVDELASLITNAGACATFDRGRDVTHPCTFCGQRSTGLTDSALFTIGFYPNGNMLARPVCSREGCRKIAGLWQDQVNAKSKMNGSTPLAAADPNLCCHPEWIREKFPCEPGECNKNPARTSRLDHLSYTKGAYDATHGTLDYKCGFPSCARCAGAAEPTAGERAAAARQRIELEKLDSGGVGRVTHEQARQLFSDSLMGRAFSAQVALLRTYFDQQEAAEQDPQLYLYANATSEMLMPATPEQVRECQRLATLQAQREHQEKAAAHGGAGGGDEDGYDMATEAGGTHRDVRNYLKALERNGESFRQGRAWNLLHRYVDRAEQSEREVGGLKDELGKLKTRPQNISPDEWARAMRQAAFPGYIGAHALIRAHVTDPDAKKRLHDFLSQLEAEDEEWKDQAYDAGSNEWRRQRARIVGLEAERDEARSALAKSEVDRLLIGKRLSGLRVALAEHDHRQDWEGIERAARDLLSLQSQSETITESTAPPELTAGNAATMLDRPVMLGELVAALRSLAKTQTTAFIHTHDLEALAANLERAQ